MQVRKYIIEIIDQAIKTLQHNGFLGDFEAPYFQVLKPKGKDYGDYAVNVAMEIGKKQKIDPIEVAEKIKEEIAKDNEFFNYFDLAEVVSPGFINFRVSQQYLWQVANNVLKEKEKFGNLEIGKNKKIQVEFISANPTGPLTVGNGRGGPFGDVLANVFKKAGYKTEKAYYVNDFGNQVLSLGHSVLKDKEAKYSGEYINSLNQKLAKPNSDAYKIGQEAAKIILETMLKKTIEKMNIHYDEWFSEASLHQKGEIKKITELLNKKNLIYESEGAQWFKASLFGDERDRVLLRSDGTPTYLAGDIAYHKYKFEKNKFDRVINVWGADHFGDVPGLLAGTEAIGHKGKLEIILLQFVTVMKNNKPVKMSKRLGTAITMDDLLEELPIDVVRFFFLQKSANTHLNFDMDLAKEQSEKNPVFYVQYAFARISSILRNAGLENTKQKKINNIELLGHEKELDLIRQINYFPEIIEDIAFDYQVHRLTQYVLDLASAFHQFYNECHVLVDDENLKNARLGLVLATQIVLKNSLDLLGISAPQKM
ncbi:MAG: arginine--tRNA ligase [Candidatus Paceibacterota bacterium]